MQCRENDALLHSVFFLSGAEKQSSKNKVDNDQYDHDPTDSDPRKLGVRPIHS